MTPSKLRRKGREAFFWGGNSKEECPFKNSWNRNNWIEGWDEAEINFNTEQIEQEEKDLDWIRNQIKDANNLNELKEALLEMYDTKF